MRVFEAAVLEMGVLDLHLLDPQLLEAQDLKPWFSELQGTSVRARV